MLFVSFAYAYVCMWAHVPACVCARVSGQNPQTYISTKMNSAVYITLCGSNE